MRQFKSPIFVDISRVQSTAFSLLQYGHLKTVGTVGLASVQIRLISRVTLYCIVKYLFFFIVFFVELFLLPMLLLLLSGKTLGVLSYCQLNMLCYQLNTGAPFQQA